MALRNYINTSTEGALSVGVGTGDVTFVLSGAGLTNIPPTPFYIRIDPDTATEEVCLVTGGTATSLTVTRGYDGTSASSHTAGAKVRHVVAAEFFNKTDAHVEASTNVHGLSGGAAVVGTSQAQTLTNKTLNASVTDVAHTTSPSASQAHRVAADNATGRHGFVWDNTGGSTGKAFLAKVSGVEKTYISGDGNLVVGGTATTTGLTNTGAIDTTGTLHAGGAVDFDATLNVDGTATVNQLNVTTSAAVTGALSSGALSAASSAIAGNETVGGTLSVTGDSNFTGQLRLPLLTSGGIQSRLVSNARSGDNLYEGKNAAASTVFVVRDTGRIQAWENAYIYNGTAPVVAGVSSTAVVTAPSAGMYVWDASDGLLKRYTGSAWVAVGPRSVYALASADLTLTGTLADVPGATVTFTTNVANTVVDIRANFDWELTATGTGNCNGRVVVDGTVAGENALFNAQAAPTRSAGGFNTRTTLATAGSHTIKLQGNKDVGGGGTAFFRAATATGIHVTIYDR